jgi:bifunctional polynucleotide phosphatase/kinase
LNNAQHKEKMAAFDYDWTLVKPKYGKKFPSNINDWEWLFPSITSKLIACYEQGYMIVIFTNQSKPWKHEQIKQVLRTLNIPLFIVVANDKIEYKPNPSLLDELMNDYIVNKSESFFVGDALGRSGDFSDSDKQFAENIGVRCYSPEEYFASFHKN